MKINFSTNIEARKTICIEMQDSLEEIIEQNIQERYQSIEKLYNDGLKTENVSWFAFDKNIDCDFKCNSIEMTEMISVVMRNLSKKLEINVKINFQKYNGTTYTFGVICEQPAE